MRGRLNRSRDIEGAPKMLTQYGGKPRAGNTEVHRHKVPLGIPVLSVARLMRRDIGHRKM